jgi:hypothetical protein
LLKKVLLDLLAFTRGGAVDGSGELAALKLSILT